MAIIYDFSNRKPRKPELPKNISTLFDEEPCNLTLDDAMSEIEITVNKLILGAFLTYKHNPWLRKNYPSDSYEQDFNRYKTESSNTVSLSKEPKLLKQRMILISGLNDDGILGFLENYALMKLKPVDATAMQLLFSQKPYFRKRLADQLIQRKDIYDLPGFNELSEEDVKQAYSRPTVVKD